MTIIKLIQMAIWSIRQGEDTWLRDYVDKSLLGKSRYRVAELISFMLQE